LEAAGVSGEDDAVDAWVDLVVWVDGEHSSSFLDVIAFHAFEEGFHFISEGCLLAHIFTHVCSRSMLGGLVFKASFKPMLYASITVLGSISMGGSLARILLMPMAIKLVSTMPVTRPKAHCLLLSIILFFSY
jgi:hypothetical protein